MEMHGGQVTLKEEKTYMVLHHCCFNGTDPSFGAFPLVSFLFSTLPQIVCDFFF